MPKPPLPEAAVALLRKPNPAVITTLRRDDQPISTATWYQWDDGRVLVNMDEGRKRLEHMRLDRHGAGRVVRRIARRAGITKTVGPHTLRHSFAVASK